MNEINNLSPDNIWFSFKNSLKDVISEFPIEAFESSWISRQRRSEFYFENLLQKLENKLDLKYKTEKPLRVDAIFFKSGSQNTEIPYIYIESENNPNSSHEEMLKLCCLNAPLKVLFICTHWTEYNKSKITTENWTYIIDDFAESNLLSGNTCVIIADWSEELIFHTYCYNKKGEVFEDNILMKVA